MSAPATSVIGTCAQCHKERSLREGRKLCEGCRQFNSGVKKGRIRKPDFAEVTIASYKEPMQKVEDGYGYYGAITTTKDNQHVQCHICGFYFANLSSHVKHKHEMDVRDYKMTYGLRITDGLLSPIARQAAQSRYNMSARVTQEGLTKAWEAAAKKRGEGWQPGGNTWAPITRNEKGMCRDQTIAKIQHCASLNNDVAVEKYFYQMYGFGQRSTIEHWFGDWNNATREAGVKSFKGMRKDAREESKVAIIAEIKAFYKHHHRTPQHADFESLETMHSYKQVYRLFGSLNDARAAAEVPLLVKINNRWEELES
jgi:hypothetical protein